MTLSTKKYCVPGTTGSLGDALVPVGLLRKKISVDVPPTPGVPLGVKLKVMLLGTDKRATYRSVVLPGLVVLIDPALLRTIWPGAGSSSAMKYCLSLAPGTCSPSRDELLYEVRYQIGLVAAVAGAA